MLATVSAVKKQLNIPSSDYSQNYEIERMIRAASDAIENYCNRKFADDYTLPGQEPDDKPRLPYDVEDACILWVTYRYQMGGSIGVASERIDGLGQVSYSLQHVEGKAYPAPPAVIALLDPYRWLQA